MTQRKPGGKTVTQQAIQTVLEQMASGECRWIGRDDVHVYCRNPLVEVDGRWTRGTPTYKVVTDRRGYESQDWAASAETVATILRHLP